MDIKGVTISWLGHASFLIEHAGVRMYIDPYQIGRTHPDTDVILITHDHYDHLSIQDIDNVLTEETVIVLPAGCRDKLQDVHAQLRVVAIDDEIEVKGILIRAVASYNKDKKFHPKEKGWLGYVVTVNSTSIYHAGDTDLIPEMKDLSVDVALLPVSGVYVMTPKEASQAAKLVGAKKAIPMHYGSVVGDVSHAQEFVSLVGKSGVILEKE